MRVGKSGLSFFVLSVAFVLAAVVCAEAEELDWASPGDCLISPEEGELVIQKLPFCDSRILRGFVFAPIDGRIDSKHYTGRFREYPKRGGDGTGYLYNHNDGLHITLADSGGFNYLVVRGGYVGRLLVDNKGYGPPWDGRRIATITSGKMYFRKKFPQVVRAAKLSFVERQGGNISDVSCYRVGPAKARRGGPAAEEKTYGKPLVFYITGASKPPAELGKFITMRFAEKERTAYALSANARGRQDILLPAGNAVHLFTTPLPTDLPLGAVRLDLPIRGAVKGSLIHIVLQDPLNRRQELIQADVVLPASGHLRVLLDFPDQIMPPERPLWLTLTSQREARIDAGPGAYALGRAPARIEALPVKREVAWAEYLPFRKLALKGYVYMLSEPRPWMSLRETTDFKKWRDSYRAPDLLDELFETLNELYRLAPKDEVIRNYYFWINQRRLKAPEVKVRVPRVPGVPRWALLQNKAYKLLRQIPVWWIENRGVPTGEIGGGIGDDTDFNQYLPPFVFVDDTAAPMVRDAMRRLSETAEVDRLDRGLNRRVTDPLHAYEEGQNQQAQMPLVFYGDPIDVERVMVASRSTEGLTIKTAKGHRHFRNHSLGAPHLDNPPKSPDREVGQHFLMLHSSLITAWYNKNPRAIAFLREMVDSSLAHQKPGDYVTSVDVVKDEALDHSSKPLNGGYGGQASCYLAAWWLTGDEKYLGPWFWGFEKGSYSTRWECWLYDLVSRHPLKPYRKAMRETLTDYDTVTWKLTHDKKALEAGLEELIAHLTNFMYMYTEAEQMTDRIFFPMREVMEMYCGGYSRRNKIWPTMAVSYEGLMPEFAAFVLTNKPDALRIAMINLDTKPRKGLLRVWELEHGRYSVKWGPDANQDDRIDRVEGQKTLELLRYSPVEINLRPRRLMIYEFEQLERLDDYRLRADLALCASEIKITPEGVNLVVHNIGSKDSPATTLAVLNEAGKVISEVAIPPLEAPLDLVPRRIKVKVPLRAEARSAKLTLAIDPEDKIPEITEVNNRVQLPLD